MAMMRTATRTVRDRRVERAAETERKAEDNDEDEFGHSVPADADTASEQGVPRMQTRSQARQTEPVADAHNHADANDAESDTLMWQPCSVSLLKWRGSKEHVDASERRNEADGSQEDGADPGCMSRNPIDGLTMKH
ncbi:hypothetical protein L916_01561 [Phytophthora nicotianae]|uniref:Uncharacterized protein n=1 Tax=Phytophthora nicotianae TaxID=4792 RepID=W2JT88_PHYNI|nr:hypothetical protein L916_01561 [Phytophthora nicotianae]